MAYLKKVVDDIESGKSHTIEELADKIKADDGIESPLLGYYMIRHIGIP